MIKRALYDDPVSESAWRPGGKQQAIHKNDEDSREIKTQTIAMLIQLKQYRWFRKPRQAPSALLLQ
jgi:predicted transcriptional regulator